jgi:hypothetical protein
MERKHTLSPTSPEVSLPETQREMLPIFLPNGAPPLDEGPDPFDPAALRLPQDFNAALGVKRALVTIPVRKPAKEWFVKVHPDPAYHLPTAMIELKETRELYLVDRSLWSDLAGESTLTFQMLFLGITRQKVLFFWPVRLPGGRGPRWKRPSSPERRGYG